MADRQDMLMTHLSPSANGTTSPHTPTPSHTKSSLQHLESLFSALYSKTYFSGPLVYCKGRRDFIFGYGIGEDEDDRYSEAINVWAQLQGTILRFWPIKKYQEASAQEGVELPPSKYMVNVRGALIRVQGSVTLSATQTSHSRQYSNVLLFNYPESLYSYHMFSCPSRDALRTWTAALQLCAWEESRLEEIYTAYLMRNTLSIRDNIPSTLATGKMEGYAGVYLSGQSSWEWKRVWVVIQAGAEAEHQALGTSSTRHSNTTKGIFDLLSREIDTPLISTKPQIILCAGPSSKHLKKPLMTIYNVTQAYSVYPGRPELINQSAEMKIEGTFGDEDMAGPRKSKEGWVKIMPEIENSVSHAPGMMKWIVALHDAFELYGRPKAWAWDVHDPASLVFGYPEDNKEGLFLDTEIVKNKDPREERTSIIRADMTRLLQAKLARSDGLTSPPVEPIASPRSSRNSAPILPPIPTGW